MNSAVAHSSALTPALYAGASSVPLARRRVFLCFGGDWGGHPSSVKHIFKIIAKTEPVIWVNSIGQRAPRLSRRDMYRLAQKFAQRWRAAPLSSSGGAQPQAVIEPRVIPFHQFSLIRAVNRASLQWQLRPLLNRYRDAEIIIVTTNPVAADFVGAFGAHRTVYFCMDEYAEMPECDRDLMRTFEPKLLKLTDRVFATSLSLTQSKTNGRDSTVYLPQGVDFAHFQTAKALPPALQDLPRPILGFQGIVGARVDLELFEKILQRFPSASLVTLGRAEADLSRLQQYPNYRHFPAVSYAELPQWASAFDIGLIAYKHDGHTAAVNPLKLLEYLAMGQAVVSSDLPELARYASLVELASDHTAYLDALARTVARYPFKTQEIEGRRAYARNHSWEQRAETFLATCDALSAVGNASHGRMPYSTIAQRATDTRDLVASTGFASAPQSPPPAYARLYKYVRAKTKLLTQQRDGILLYHDVVTPYQLSDSGFTGTGAQVYKLEAASFDAHLRAFKQAFPEGPGLPDVANLDFKPSLTLTFDDGGYSALSEIAPRLEAFGWRGVFFITTGRIGTPGFLTAENIRQLHRRGHIIGSHSVTHPSRMSSLPYTELLREWSDSLRTLTDILGVPVQIASVPGGYCSREVLQAAEAAGVLMLMTSEPSRRVVRCGRTTVIGRFCIKFNTSASTAVALAGRSLLIQWLQWLRWNALKVLKRGLGGAYPIVRGALLNRMRTKW